jgi:hypothetical protein
VSVLNDHSVAKNKGSNQTRNTDHQNSTGNQNFNQGHTLFHFKSPLLNTFFSEFYFDRKPIKAQKLLFSIYSSASITSFFNLRGTLRDHLHEHTLQ